MTETIKLGQIVMSATIHDWVNSVDSLVHHEALLGILARHAKGDWGDLCPEDAEMNEDALLHGDRLLSVYTLENTPIWIITEADRSVTTIFFPSDY